MSALSRGVSLAQRAYRKGRRPMVGSADDRRVVIQRFRDFTGREPNLDQPTGFLENCFG
jgi:tRNA(Ser,Leu) C12 N-acetylase TAN1